MIVKPPIQGLRGELSTAELFDLLMTGHKISVYQVSEPLFTNQLSVRNCPKMTVNNNPNKCCAKIAVMLNHMNSFIELFST